MVAVNVWYHFTVALDVKLGTWSVTVNGASPAVNAIPAAAMSASAVPMSLFVGAADFQTKDTSGGWSFLYDNVICR